LFYRSFFDENIQKGKVSKVASKDVSVQTNQKNTRNYKLVFDKQPGKINFHEILSQISHQRSFVLLFTKVDIISQIGILAGAMALTTLSNTR